MKSMSELKQDGESHYKTGGIELIDLFAAMNPHDSLTIADISALTSIMRYATRMLLSGTNEVDLKDISTYAGMCLTRMEK